MNSLEFTNQVQKISYSLKPVAMNLTRDADDAKDLVQETLLKALLNKDKFKAGTNLKAWLYTIMRNIFINDYRRKAKQHTILDNSINDFLLNSNQLSIANTAETNLKMKEIQQAVHSLPDIFRNPFMLYFEGYKYNEIADLLKEPLGTIKSRIHFARKLLKEQITRF